MAEKIYKGIARLFLEAGIAKPSPKVGQAVGPLGLNMNDLCKTFNEQTKKYWKEGIPLTVLVTAYEGRTYDLRIRSPTTSYFLKLAAGIEKGSAAPGKTVAGKVDVRQIYEIAKIKQAEPHLKDVPLKNLCYSIIGSARSMGLEVIHKPSPKVQEQIIVKKKQS